MIIAQRMSLDSAKRSAENWYSLYVLTDDAARVHESQLEGEIVTWRTQLWNEERIGALAFGILSFLLFAAILR